MRAIPDRKRVTAVYMASWQAGTDRLKCTYICCCTSHSVSLMLPWSLAQLSDRTLPRKELGYNALSLQKQRNVVCGRNKAKRLRQRRSKQTTTQSLEYNATFYIMARKPRMYLIQHLPFHIRGFQQLATEALQPARLHAKAAE